MGAREGEYIGIWTGLSDKENGGGCLLGIRAEDQDRMVETAVVHARDQDQVRCTLAFRKKPEDAARQQFLSRHGILVLVLGCT